METDGLCCSASYCPVPLKPSCPGMVLSGTESLHFSSITSQNKALSEENIFLTEYWVKENLSYLDTHIQ